MLSLWVITFVSVSCLSTPSWAFSKCATSAFAGMGTCHHDCYHNTNAEKRMGVMMHGQPPCNQVNEKIMSRRSILNGALVGSAFLLGASSLPAMAVMANDSPEAQVFQAGQALGTQDALARFAKARESLDYLVSNYDDIVKNGGGDGVRRYLGTVGVTSGLYGIKKVLKELQEEANDVVEYTEAMNEFDSSLVGADTACYSANFVEYSAAKTKPEQFFEDALLEAERMQFAMQDMAKQLENVK